MELEGLWELWAPTPFHLPGREGREDPLPPPRKEGRRDGAVCMGPWQEATGVQGSSLSSVFPLQTSWRLLGAGKGGGWSPSKEEVCRGHCWESTQRRAESLNVLASSTKLWNTSILPPYSWKRKKRNYL